MLQSPLLQNCACKFESQAWFGTRPRNVAFLSFFSFCLRFVGGVVYNRYTPINIDTPMVQLLKSACTSMCRHMYNWNIVECDVSYQFTHSLTPKFPREGPGVKSRMCPPYPQRDRKRRLNGAVCRNHRIKKVVPCRCLDGHVKEPCEMSMALGARP